MNKKTLLSMMMLLCFAFMGAARADELTVHDGTDTNGFIPMYGGYFDDFTKSEFVFPASELADMTGSMITSMIFYVSGLGNSLNGWNTTQQVFLKEVASETLSDYSGIEGATIVFEGSLTAPTTGPSELEITFSTPYTYNGGNLLVGIYNTTKGTFQFVYFYGETVTGASGAGYNSTSLANVSFTQRDFLPKTTFKYGCVPPVQFTANEVGPSFATLSWTEVGNSESWYIYYYVQTYGTTGPEEESIEVFENPYTLTGLNPYTTYEAYVIPSCGVVDDDPDNSLMSNTITFSTLEYCPTPRNVAMANISDTEATVTWSDYDEVYEVQLGTLSDNSDILMNESFDNGFPNNNDWQISPTYPWIIVDGHMQSNNAGVENSTSSVTLSMYLYDAGTIQFDAECRGEGTGSYLYDKCIFSIDSIEQFAYGAQVSGWNHYSFDVAAGEHTFTWSYTKDRSVDPDGDYFAVDNVVVGINEYEWDNSISVENPSYTFTGLDPVTEYYVHVMGVCGLGSPRPTITGWSEPIHFTTLGYYTVSVSANPANAGTVSGGGEIFSGNTCTVNATANPGYYFVSWTKNGVEVGENYLPEYTFTVSENTNIVANFEQIEFYPWFTSMPEEGGYGYYSVGGESVQSVHFGDTLVIYAIPNENFTFYKWTMWRGYDNNYSYVDLSTSPIDTIVIDESFLNNYNGVEQGEIEFIANFVESIGDCVRPVNFSVTEVGPNLAKLGWTELGTSQAWMLYYRPAYTPAYVPYDSLEIYQNPYTLIGLQPNTSYEAYIVPSCGFTDGIANEYLASNTVTFTTLEACPTPFNVQVNNITSNSASLTWTGYSDSYTMDYRVATELAETIFNEGFEGGVMPQGWNNEGAASWIIDVGDYTTDSIGAHNGNYNAKITHGNSSDQTYLVTPALDLSNQNNLAVSFWYINRSWSGDIDELGVYYRIGEQGEWNELWSTSEAHETWTNQVVELTNLADEYQIGFLFTDHYGYGVGLDDIIIVTEVVSEWVTIDNVTSPLALTDLTPNTDYEVRVQGLCGDTITNWSNSAFFTTAEAQSYTITVSANPNNGGTVTGTGTYIQGSSCIVTATATTGYTFTNWTENGNVVSTSPTYSFTVTTNRTLVANFSLNRYAITATANPTGGGTVSGSGTYNHGAPVTLTATPNAGYTFLNWTKNGQVVSSNTTYTFTASGAGTYVANFQQIEYYPWFTVLPENGGSAEIQGDGIVHYGDQVTIIATPNTGYDFVNWTTENFESAQALYLSNQATYTFTMDNSHLLTELYPDGGEIQIFANFELQSFEITVMAEEGGTVTGSSTGTYAYGDTLHLNAVANQGYTFTNWTKNGTVVSTTANSDFVVTETATYVAHFSTNAYQITASTNPTGAGTVTGTGEYNYGASCTLTVTPNEGYTFVNWTKDGQVVGTSTSITFTVTGDADYVANFNTNSYEITASTNPTGAGTISGTGEYNYGASCTLTVTPNEGYTFVNWTKDGQVVGTSTSITFTVTGDADYVANFNTNSYEITASTNPTGAGTISGTGEYNYGASCTLTVTPNEGYTFVNWTKDGQVVGTSTSITFTVTGDADYVANFNTNTYEITASTNPTGAGTISGTGEYNYGASCTLSVTPNPGYTFVNWTKDGTMVSDNMSFSITVTESAAYVANFSVNSYEITASANPTAGGTVTGANTYNFGEQATLTANANTGYTFANWTLNGTVVGTNPTITFTVSGSAAYVANFSVNSYEITASANPTAGGTVTGANTYNFGEQATLTANANTGYTFVNWTENGNVVYTSPTYSFTVEGPRTLVANFQLNSYEITASANPTAGGTVTGANIYNFGEQATLTANANTGYTFINWTENGNVVSTSPTYSFTVEGPRTLVANFSVNGYEITASTNPTGAGTITGTGPYDYGQTCTLTATANEGYTFANWTLNGTVVGTNPTITFTVFGSAAYVANFSVNSYEITASANPTAGGTVTGANTYNFGEQATLTANANTGYTFVNWTENGNVVSTSPTYSFTVEGPRTLVANFQLNSYEITASANPTAGGSVTGANTYNFGEQATLTANANTGYTFINWTENGNVVSTSPTYSFTVEGPRTLVANFQLNSYEITASANPTAGGSVTGANTYNFGEQATLTANANTGYTFINWTENGNVVSTIPTYSFTVEGPRNLVANFQLNSYEITASANPTAGGSVSGADTYDHFETCTLIATESTGYTFTNWTENGNVVSTSPTYSFTVEGPRNLVANFQLNSYEITASANPSAGGSVSGAGTYDHFETCTLIATESTGYTFTNWTENGNVVSTSPTYSFTVEGPRTLVANFQLNSYEITASANPAAGGSVSGAGTYDHFETCTLIATESTGYTFINWTENGNVVSTSPTYSFMVEGTRTLVANFQINSYEITASANPTVGGSVIGAGTYNHFETAILTATASTGYTFINWTENGTVVSTSPTISFMVEGPRTLVANFQLNSYQITAIANPTAGGTATGTGTYNHFESCTLVATPNEYYVFTNWTKNGQVVSDNATYTFTVEGGGTYVAHFTRVNHQITVLANPTEGGSVSGEGSYPHGSYCTLTATANTGYTFFNWTKNGVVVSSNPSYSFPVTEDATYTANFNLNNFLVTVAADPAAGGSVSGGGAYLFGSNCTVSAMANTGYTFTNWTVNGTVVSTDANYTFPVNGNTDLIAHFSLNHYNITVSVDPEVGGSATGGGSFTYGETCNLTATPNTGYAFVNWTKNGSVVSNNANYSFTVTDNGDYVAHFAVARYTITLVAQPAEGGSVHGAGNYDYGHVVILRAIAHEGYEFINWTRDGAVVSSNANYSIVVRENAEYVANFRPYVFEIKANTDPDNTGDIEGVGLYNYGETCTLTVTPHDDYEFINWTLNGEVVSEEESISFIVTEAREYVAHLEYVEGIDEQSNLSVTLYPNPAKFKLTIEASEPIKMLEIFTIDGALVSKQDYSSDKIMINVDTFASGTYMIRLTTDSAVEIRRFVKE